MDLGELKLACHTYQIGNCEEESQSAVPCTPTSSTYSTASSTSSVVSDPLAERRGHSQASVRGRHAEGLHLTEQRDVIDHPSIKAPRVSPKASTSFNKQDDVPAITRALYNCLSWFTGKMPKIPLEKGYSQMDWLRLAQSQKNLNGLSGGRLREDITMDEVRQHKTKEDAWMVFNGMVYNITPYLRFHPGGSEILMKAAGRDGTSLFMKYHAWVNIGALMGKCLVGRLALSPIQAQAAADVQQARLMRQQQPSQQQASPQDGSQAASPQATGSPQSDEVVQTAEEPAVESVNHIDQETPGAILGDTASAAPGQGNLEPQESQVGQDGRGSTPPDQGRVTTGQLPVTVDP